MKKFHDISHYLTIFFKIKSIQITIKNKFETNETKIVEIDIHRKYRLM